MKSWVKSWGLVGSGCVGVMCSGVETFRYIRIKREKEKEELKATMNSIVETKVKAFEKRMQKKLEEERIRCYEFSTDAKLAASNAEYYSAMARKGGE